MHVRTLENKAFIALVALVTVAFAWTIRGFLMPVFWAIVLAVLFTPLFNRIRRAVGGRSSLASLLTLLVVLVAVVVPIALIGAAVTNEAVGLYGVVASGEVDLAEPVHLVEGWMPELTRRAEELGLDLDRVREGIATTALNASRTVASRLLDVGQQALGFALMLAVTFYVLFFFLRDGEQLAEGLVRALPLGDPRERRLFTRFSAVTRATVKGSFLVAAAQGMVGGLAFAFLGLVSPLLWGVMMGLLSLIPAVGSALVWGPAAIYLFATGAWVKGVILVVVGAGVIGTIDNALRPILVGRDAGMPDYLILLSTLGGLAAFGISGIVVGPVVAGLFLTVWDIFTEEFGAADADTDSELRPVPSSMEPIAPPAAPPLAPPAAPPADPPEPDAGPAAETP